MEGSRSRHHWYLSQAIEEIITQSVEIQMLKEDLYRATSKRTSPQEVAKLKRQLKEMEASLSNTNED